MDGAAGLGEDLRSQWEWDRDRARGAAHPGTLSPGSGLQPRPQGQPALDTFAPLRSVVLDLLPPWAVAPSPRAGEPADPSTLSLPSHGVQAKVGVSCGVGSCPAACASLITSKRPASPVSSLPRIGPGRYVGPGLAVGSVAEPAPFATGRRVAVDTSTDLSSGPSTWC